MTVAVAHKVSDTSRAALSQAVREASQRETDLAVLHVVDSIDADRTEAYRAGISDEIETVVGGPPDVRWQLHLRTVDSDLGEALVTLTDDVGAELLVIGARRRSPLGKALLGSVAQTIILTANVPVLVVKAPGARARRE
jgi:nucleotide-binding universal stress UspA family protein